jgi:hypothetical protein
MDDVEKIVYILQASLHDLPNERALRHIAEIILKAINEED